MPSGAGITVECAGSVQMQERYPQEETDDAKEGTATHWVVSSVLDAFKFDNGSIISGTYVGKIAPNGIIITEEMVEAANEHVFDVLNTVQSFGGLQTLQVEQRTKAGAIHPDNWGTPDTSAFHAGRNTVYLWDFKYGHRYVDIFENWQFLNYAIMITDGFRDSTTVVMRVVQPRCFSAAPVREWSITVGELRPYRNRLEAAFIEALSENPTIQSGPHCRDCSGRHACKAAQRSAESAIDYASNLSSGVWEMSNEALGTTLNILQRAVDAIDLLQSGLKQDALNRCKAGQFVPGWEAAPGKGRKTWNKPHAEVLALGKMLDFDLAKPALVTPNQAEKMGIDGAVIDAYSDTPSTGIKLVKDKGTKAKQVFTQSRGNQQ